VDLKADDGFVFGQNVFSAGDGGHISIVRSDRDSVGSKLAICLRGGLVGASGADNSRTILKMPTQFKRLRAKGSDPDSVPDW